MQINLVNFFVLLLAIHFILNSSKLTKSTASTLKMCFYFYKLNF